MSRLHLFIAFFLLAGFPARAGITSTYGPSFDYRQPPPWLLTVRSTYRDEKTGALRTYSGIGVLAQLNARRAKNKRYFALTVSHLSQGEGLEIYLGNGDRDPLKTGARVALNLRDAELVEIIPDRPIQALFEYNRSEEMFVVTGEDMLVWWPVIEAARREGAAGYFHSQFIQVDRDETVIVPNALWDPAELPQARRPFARRYYEENDWEARTAMFGTLDGSERLSPVQLKPGSSGAPVIGLFRSFRIALTGMASRTQRFSEFSHFVPPDAYGRLMKAMLKLGKKYRDGRKNILDGTTWGLRQGLTYRTTADGVKEIVPLTVSVAAVTSAPSGNGSSHDGGTSKPAGNGGSHDGGSGGLKPYSNPEADVFKDFAIDPGVLDGNDKVLAYSLRLKDRTYFLNGSLASRRVTHLTRRLAKSAKLTAPLRLQDIFPGRFGQTTDHFSGHSENGEFEYLRGQIRLLLKESGGKSTACITFRTDGSREGAPDGFRPLFQISGSNQTRFSVDVSHFLFIEPSYARLIQHSGTSAEPASEKTKSEEWIRRLNHASARVFFRVSPLDRPEEPVDVTAQWRDIRPLPPDQDFELKCP